MATSKPEVPDFLEFRERFWLRENFWYHRNAWEKIQRHNRLIMLIHPGATKTMTWAIEHSAYQLIRDPNYRILAVQKSAEESVKVVGAVQDRLTSREFYDELLRLPPGQNPIDLWGPFKPDRRYRETASWGADHFRMQGFTSGEKDYSMQAKGAGSANLSVRADLIILDDIQEPGDDTPAGTAKLLRWLQQAIITRVYPNQKIIILGSRLGPTDIYARLLEDPEFADWPVVRYPAIQSHCMACRTRRSYSKNQKCSHAERARMLVPELRDYPRPGEEEGRLLWDYKGLVKRRKEAGSHVWWTSYMMQEGDFSEAIFKKDAIEKCFNTDYALGEIPEQVSDIFIGVDPAIAQYCAMIVWGLDRRSGQRYLIDIFNRKGMRTYRNIQHKVVELAATYRANVAAIEFNATQGSISNDPDFVKELRAMGCKVVTYQTRTRTGARAETDEFDISSIGALFDEGLITIPYQDDKTRERVNAYVDQLLDWRPKPENAASWSLVRDMVMATLFAESQATEVMQRSKAHKEHRPSRAPRFTRDRMERWKEAVG